MILLPGGNGDFSRIIPGVSVRAQRMAVQLTALRSVSSGVETSSADNESGGHNARIHLPGEDYTGRLAQDQCTAQGPAIPMQSPQPTCGPPFLPNRREAVTYVPFSNNLASERSYLIGTIMNGTTKLEAQSEECLRSCSGRSPRYLRTA